MATWTLVPGQQYRLRLVTFATANTIATRSGGRGHNLPTRGLFSCQAERCGHSSGTTS